MCMIDDAEPLDFCLETIRKARKLHVCSECDRTIAPEEQYVYTSYGKDGDMGSNKTCQHCLTAAQWLRELLAAKKHRSILSGAFWR
jgi:hypothetical protein